MELKRDKVIIKTSVIGIIVNIFLSVLKVIIGLITNSIAITLDAINNISDATSSVITIIGTKLASKEPDKKHPFGYGRIEYFTALLISIIILYAGVTSFGESIKSVIAHEEPLYTTVTLIIVAIGVIIKFILGKYFVKVGKKVDSASLINSGEEANLDSIISLSTLIAAGIFIGTGLSLEAYLGVIISAFIIKSGCEMLRETISRLLGERIDAELAKNIVNTIKEFDAVKGVYDLVLNDYGPESYHGSVHIEVPDTYTANEIDELLRNISVKVYHKHNVILTAIGVYSINTKDQKAIQIREEIRKLVLEDKFITQIHGFYLNESNKTIRFDAVINFDTNDRKKVYNEMVEKVKQKYPDYNFSITLDTDFIEL